MSRLEEFVSLLTGRFNNDEQYQEKQKEGLSFPYAEHVNTVCNQKINGLPADFAGVFMAICYSISYGIAAGFIFYCITKICKKQAKQIHPILWVATILFVINFVLLAII